jgi:hypothetical protein
VGSLSRSFTFVSHAVPPPCLVLWSVAGLLVPVFGLLGWWLFSPPPEPVVSSPTEKTSYDSYFKNERKIRANDAGM